MNEKGVWEALTSPFMDPGWWSEKVIELAIFTWLINFLIKRTRDAVHKRERAPYEGWRLIVLGYGDPPQKLEREEVRRFLESDFERWKLVKSVASGNFTLTGRTIHEAEAADPEKRWVSLDRAAKTLTVDLTRLPPDQGRLKQDENPPALSGGGEAPQSEAL